MRRASVAALVLAFSIAFLALGPAHAQSSEVRYDYVIEDPADDVLLIAGNGSERWSDKPEVDLLEYTSRVEGSDLVQTLTFDGALPEGVRTELTLTLTVGAQAPFPLSLSFTGDEVATAGTRSANATATVSGDTFTVRLPMEQLAGATCFSPRVKVVYDPENDPITSTDAGAQGWEDQLGLRASRCVMSFGEEPVMPIEDGLDGTCPPATIPSGVQVEGTWDDPRGDVREGLSFDPATVDMPDADILQLTSELDGDEIVVRLTLAQFPNERHFPLVAVKFELEGQDQEFDFDGKDAIDIGFDHPTHDAYGSVVDAQGETAQRATFYARGAREGDAFVARFCASIVPDDALCWAPQASVQYNEGDRPIDKVEFDWNEGPCAGKVRGGGSAPGGDDGAGDGGTDDGSGNADDGAGDGGQGAGDGQDAGEDAGADGENGAPGFGVLALVAAALAAAVFTRRRA